MDVFMAGFDYSFQTKTDFTYFNLCYYAPIQMAIKEGIQKIYYRRKAEKVKLARGCEPEKTFSFVKCHNNLLRTIINIAARTPIYFYLKNWLSTEPL
jgi:predicted N-acyltransferase